jgi:hypothetical protein
VAALVPAAAVAPEFPVPRLHEAVAKVAPATPLDRELERAVYRLNWLSAAGTGILLAALVGLGDTVACCVFAAALSVIACTQIPLRARFLASKNDLDQTAECLIRGSRPLVSRAGCFELGAMQVKSDGSVTLWTDSHHDNRCALVRTRSPKVLGAVNEIDLGSGWRYAFFKDPSAP